MTSLVQSVLHMPRLRQCAKFCLVGGSGVVVDMAVLHLLAIRLGWNVSLGKICAAETALLNNFLWNEVWTFREAMSSTARAGGSWRGVACRLWRFQAICVAGIGLAVGFLHLFHTGLGFNLYLANLLAIGLVTLWNFSLNARFTWYGAGKR